MLNQKTEKTRATLLQNISDYKSIEFSKEI